MRTLKSERQKLADCRPFKPQLFYHSQLGIHSFKLTERLVYLVSKHQRSGKLYHCLEQDMSLLNLTLSAATPGILPKLINVDSVKKLPDSRFSPVGTQVTELSVTLRSVSENSKPLSHLLGLFD